MQMADCFSFADTGKGSDAWGGNVYNYDLCSFLHVTVVFYVSNGPSPISSCAVSLRLDKEL